MNSPRPMLTILLAVAVASLTACGPEPSEHSRAALQPVAVTVAAVDRTTGATRSDIRGVVQPARQAVVSGRVTGPVVSVSVGSGDRVPKGHALLEIQPTAIDGEVAQARGALAQAEAALAMAERNHSRFAALHAERAVSDAELDAATMQRDQARAAVEQAQGAVTSVSSIADDAVVRAPFDARVVDTLVEIGDLAAPGRPLVQLESLEARQIWLTVRASDIERVSVGQELPVQIDSRSDLGEIVGHVAEIVPSADSTTHSFTVKVDLRGVDVRSGLTGHAEIWTPADDRLVVPPSAVHHRGGLELVVVRADDGSARTRAVTTGATQADGRIEVLSGVAAGEVVVTDLPAPVADGTPLEVAR